MTAMRATRRCVAIVTVGTLLGLAAPGIVAPQPAQALPAPPIEDAFTPPGPYPTTTTTVSVPGHAPYALFYAGRLWKPRLRQPDHHLGQWH